MTDEILINVTPTESRVAVVENGLLQELYLERWDDGSYVGNIYMGRVERVLPGMQAAFVNIGLDRTAFLHANDIMPRQPELTEEGEPVAAPPISDLLSQGQNVLVQVIKDPLGTKGARLTTQLSIPSRYLVLLPEVDNIGVSVRIESEEERQRLRDLVRRLVGEESKAGFILRTNAEDVGEEALARDLDYLRRLWQRIAGAMESAEAGQCIYEDLSLPFRSLRDLMHGEVEKVRIDDARTVAEARLFAREFFPDWVDRIEPYGGDGPLFDLYGVEDEIERALSRTVALKSGGHLTIDQTEAMTTVDVNTGAYVGFRNLEDTIYKTNLESAQAIARQLRLRNLGGIIIIDFIDMLEVEHRQQVMQALERALERDPARTQIMEVSALGLVEMTRKRTRESLEHLLCEPCPSCEGRGFVKTAETVCYEIFRDIVRQHRQFEFQELMVIAHQDVVERLLDEESASLAELEEFTGKPIRLQTDAMYAQEQFDVVLM